jgi:hypothetical protein
MEFVSVLYPYFCKDVAQLVIDYYFSTEEKLLRFFKYHNSLYIADWKIKQIHNDVYVTESEQCMLMQYSLSQLVSLIDHGKCIYKRGEKCRYTRGEVHEHELNEPSRDIIKRTIDQDLKTPKNKFPYFWVFVACSLIFLAKEIHFFLPNGIKK